MVFGEQGSGASGVAYINFHRDRYSNPTDFRGAN
jgi:hypothetical protein